MKEAMWKDEESKDLGAKDDVTKGGSPSVSSLHYLLDHCDGVLAPGISLGSPQEALRRFRNRMRYVRDISVWNVTSPVELV